MRTLVLGGIRSGKSGWAESAMDRPGRVRYLATGPSSDTGPSWSRRLADHRSRRPADWVTVETADVAGHLRSDRQTPTVVDDLGGWLTGLLDGRGWQDTSIEADLDALAESVAGFAAALVLVSPEVGLSVVPATAAGCRFADELGRLNQRIAAVCDRVVLVVAGQPLWVKR